jgi:hypothetical protein
VLFIGERLGLVSLPIVVQPSLTVLHHRFTLLPRPDLTLPCVYSFITLWAFTLAVLLRDERWPLIRVLSVGAWQRPF